MSNELADQRHRREGLAERRKVDRLVDRAIGTGDQQAIEALAKLLYIEQHAIALGLQTLNAHLSADYKESAAVELNEAWATVEHKQAALKRLELARTARTS